MDPVSAFGIAVGIIGLLPICANGYSFIEGICEAHGGVQKQLVKVQMQRRVCQFVHSDPIGDVDACDYQDLKGEICNNCRDRTNFQKLGAMSGKCPIKPQTIGRIPDCKDGSTEIPSLGTTSTIRCQTYQIYSSTFTTWRLSTGLY